MSKHSESDEEIIQKDEKTAKYLHKIAESGKERGLSNSIVAFYEKKAWDASKSDEKYTSCKKCGMPPPPPIDTILKSSPSETCRNCGEVNKNRPIGLASDIEKNEEIVKRKNLKRKSGENSDEKPAAVTSIRVELPREKPRKVAQVIPKPAAIPPLQTALQSKSAAKRAAEKKKKVRIMMNDQPEPNFLQSFMKTV